MANNKKRFESMLFNYESTARTDFRGGKIEPLIRTKYKETGAPCAMVRPGPLKDIHSLTDWKVPNVPFDLFWKPKECVRRNPNDVQQPYGRAIDYERKTVQKTRPRLKMVPAVDLDDLDDVRRKILMDSMYVTSTQETMRDALTDANYCNVRAPLPERPAPANPITIEKFLPPFVSPEWRMDSISWDNRQLRSYCDPTQNFWLSRTTNCNVCTDTTARNAMKKQNQKH